MKKYALIQLLFLPFAVFAQNSAMLFIDHINTIITVHDNGKGFTKKITLKGAAVDNETLKIPFGELDKIKIESAEYSQKNNKSKRLKKSTFFESSVPSYSFYSGYRYMNIPIPETSEFEISYTISNPHLLFLSYIDFSEKYLSDSAKTTILLPDKFELIYKLPEDSIPGLTFVVNEHENGHTYNFSYNPLYKKAIDTKDDLPIFHKKLKEPPVARLIVCEKGISPAQTMNNWILSLNRSRQTLNHDWAEQIDFVTQNAGSNREIAEKCFSYVQKEINYIDIENGLRAFQPKDANEILMCKKGDCKDMANLLASILQYKGLEAYYAIVPTTGHVFDLDFISTISCNHAVCLLRLDDGDILLDATDTYTAFGEPSMHTQGQKMLIISEDGPELSAIPVCRPKNNHININMSLIYDKTLTGQLSLNLTGKSQAYHKYMTSSVSSDYKQKMTEHFIDLFDGKFDLENISFAENDTTTAITADISINSSYIIPINNMLYLNPSFLPKPYYYEPGNEITKTKIILPFTLSSNINCSILFPEYGKILTTDSLIFQAEDQRVTFRSNTLKPNQLQITVAYENPNLIIEGDNLDIFKELNEKVENSYEKTIKVL